MYDLLHFTTESDCLHSSLNSFDWYSHTIRILSLTIYNKFTIVQVLITIMILLYWKWYVPVKSNAIDDVIELNLLAYDYIDFDYMTTVVFKAPHAGHYSTSDDVWNMFNILIPCPTVISWTGCSYFNWLNSTTRVGLGTVGAG